MTALSGHRALPHATRRGLGPRRRLCCGAAAAIFGLCAVIGPGAPAAAETGASAPRNAPVIELWGFTTLVEGPVYDPGAPTAATASAPALPHFTGPEFNQLFVSAGLPNLAPITDAPSITDSDELDADIRAVAQERGYQRRPLPADGRQLRLVDAGLALQPAAAAAWQDLAEDAAAHGYELVLNSAYRGHRYQRVVFLRRVEAPHEIDDFEARMRQSAPPGYSKHHTGYAIDVGQPGYRDFGRAPVYEWLAADNFANAKKHGWIPSYPPDGGRQGPVPEPWEFTYVGVEAILCFHQHYLTYDPTCSG